MSLGEVFLNERKNINKTQTVVANEVGLSQTYLCSIETNRRIPTINVVQKLSAYYGKPLWLILSQDISDVNIPEGKEYLYKRLINQIKELSKEIYTND